MSSEALPTVRHPQQHSAEWTVQPATPDFHLWSPGKPSARMQRAIPDATLEVWQTTPGHYDIDRYRFRATLVANSSGDYSFDSVFRTEPPDWLDVTDMSDNNRRLHSECRSGDFECKGDLSPASAERNLEQRVSCNIVGRLTQGLRCVMLVDNFYRRPIISPDRLFSPPLVSAKLARSNPRLERLKALIRVELGRPLTDHEEHLLELSAVLLDVDEETKDE